MVDSLKKKECSGCTACKVVCPRNAIKMEEDREGFLYPQIDYSLCVKCGKCDKVCHSKNDKRATNEKNIVVYAGINKSEKIRIESSSGGIFSLLAERILALGGVVFGAGFDEMLNVVHMPVTSEKELWKLRGSKYVQSDMDNNFSLVKNELENERYVLFCGTPCQVNGLLNYLIEPYERLYTVDFICHGVPSPKVWEAYLNELKLKYGEINVKERCSFRDKDKGWINYSLKIPFEHLYCKDKTEDPFLKAFLKNLCLRPSCYDCHSKGIQRRSDITLADYWAIKKFDTEQFDDKGASLIFLQSEKGKELLKKIEEDIKLWKVDLDKMIPYITSAYSSVPYNKKRSKFMNRIGQVEIERLVEIYGRMPIILKVKIGIVSIINKIQGKRSKWD